MKLILILLMLSFIASAQCPISLEGNKLCWDHVAPSVDEVIINGTSYQVNCDDDDDDFRDDDDDDDNNNPNCVYLCVEEDDDDDDDFRDDDDDDFNVIIETISIISNGDTLDCTDVLPIDNIEFAVTKFNGYNAMIAWQVEDAISVSILRSTNGVKWETLATLDPKFNTFIDYVFGNGTHYYKLKVCYEDGTEVYSSIKSVDLEIKSDIIVYNTYNQVVVIKPGKKLVELMDLSGKIYNTYTVYKDRLIINVNGFPHGMYIIRVNGESFKIIL